MCHANDAFPFCSLSRFPSPFCASYPNLLASLDNLGDQLLNTPGIQRTGFYHYNLDIRLLRAYEATTRDGVQNYMYKLMSSSFFPADASKLLACSNNSLSFCHSADMVPRRSNHSITSFGLEVSSGGGKFLA